MQFKKSIQKNCFLSLNNIFKTFLYDWKTPDLDLLPGDFYKAGVTYAIYSTFCVLKILMNVLWINIYSTYTKFNKLNKRRRKGTFLITQFKIKHRSLISGFKNYFCIAFAFLTYLAFIFSTFSVYLWWVVWSTLVSIQIFLT